MPLWIAALWPCGYEKAIGNRTPRRKEDGPRRILSRVRYKGLGCVQVYSSIGFPLTQTRIDIVSYRGPDGRGWREFSSPAGTVALGHRRLAIIDLSNNGLQPMANSSGRFHLIFNGELYNYLELRQQLAQRGEIFCTETDSEVLLRAYQAWGEQALARFRGMFAFVIWDDMEKRLFAARDRFGIKPLYLVANNAGVALASEIKQLLGLPGLTGRMNLPRARDFLAGGIADHTAETLFENVMQLRGGECLSVHAGTSGRLCIRRRRWYSPTDPRQNSCCQKLTQPSSSAIV